MLVHCPGGVLTEKMVDLAYSMRNNIWLGQVKEHEDLINKFKYTLHKTGINVIAVTRTPMKAEKPARKRKSKSK